MTEDWRLYFPSGRLDPRPERHRQAAEWLADALSRLGERPLGPAGSMTPLVVRLLCIPTWSPVCSVRLEPSGLWWRLVSRELDGEAAGFEMGELAHRDERLVTGTEADRVTELWACLRFWSLGPAAGEDDALDGTTYALEAAEGGRYHVALRNDPEWGDTFGEFSDLLVRLAGLAPR